MKIALFLEGCNFYVLKKQPDKVIARIDTARQMCKRLYGQDRNAQVLEGKCEWTLARMYKFIGEYEKAKMHIDTAFALTANCEKGEQSIMIYYVNGSIILVDKEKSQQDLKRAINSFKSAIAIASEEDYGTKIAQYCKINLARAYVGSSLTNTETSGAGVSKDNIEEAKIVLKNMEHEEMHHRTRWTYLLACSDVYRLDGQMQQANAYADQALTLAQTKQLQYEVKSKLAEYRKSS